MKILLAQTGFLGDVVLSTPVIQALSRVYPAAEISFLTTPAAACLVRHNPFLRQVLVFDKRGSESGLKGLLAASRKIREHKFDLVFSLHKSWRTALLLRLAGIPVRFGFKEASGSFLYTRCASRRDLSHEVLRNLAILRNIDLDPKDFATPLSLKVPKDVEQSTAAILQNFHSGPWIAIAPGSVWPTKRWTPQGFATCAQHFAAKGYGVVLLGSASDKQSGREIERLQQVPLLNLIGKVDLLQSASIISRASLLITNDSAPLHIAAACQTPVVVVFCATVPEFGFGPWLVPSEVLGVADLGCRPCGRHGGKICPTGTNACQLQLPASEVIKAAERLLCARDNCPLNQRAP